MAGLMGLSTQQASDPFGYNDPQNWPTLTYRPDVGEGGLDFNGQPLSPGFEGSPSSSPGYQQSWLDLTGQLLNQQLASGGPEGDWQARIRALFQNPSFAQKWAQMYPDQTARNFVSGEVGAVNSQWADNGNPSAFGEITPLLLAMGGGALAAGAGGAGAAGGATAADAGAGAAAGGGAAAAGGTGAGGSAAAASGGGMDFGGDMFGNFGDFFADPSAGGMMPAAVPEADPSFGGILTQTGTGQFEDLSQFGTDAAGSASSLPSWLQNAPQFLQQAYARLFGGGGPGGGPGGSGVLGGLGSTIPGMLALGYASRQPGLDTSGLEGILGKVGGNQDAIVKAATDPLQMNIAAGYGDLLQSQSKRGIRGSSFGDTDIGNYLSTTGNTLANAGANAAEGSLALQGGLAAQIAQLKNQAQIAKNNLYGRAFDVLGRGMSPSPTFNLTGTA